MWIDVIDAHALAEGEHIVLTLENTEIALFRQKGSFYAIEDVCTHDGGTIAEGQLEEGAIVCPRHGAKFCLKTGQVQTPPAYENIRCFPVRVEQNKIQIDFSE